MTKVAWGEPICNVCFEGYHDWVHPMSGEKKLFLRESVPETFCADGWFQLATESVVIAPGEKVAIKQLLLTLVPGGAFRLPTLSEYLIGTDHILSLSREGRQLTFERHWEWNRVE
ncbi:MAG: hypothetical protein NTY30_03745 [Candidatus Berkelbacteria bacterium]|nr:hypothetical protein [Candidatus Berkelbacteria bacterium]